MTITRSNGEGASKRPFFYLKTFCIFVITIIFIKHLNPLVLRWVLFLVDITPFPLSVSFYLW